MSHLIIISALSGSGKNTVIQQLMQDESLRLSFSISATSRPSRDNEQYGVEYCSYTSEQFEKLITEDRLVEYVEVYPGKYYGTLRSEVDRLGAMGRSILFDVDAVGVMRIQEAYRDRVASIFLTSPTSAELRRRLESRGTESPKLVEECIRRASYEINSAEQFDHTVVNDDLKFCVSQVAQIIRDTINKQRTQRGSASSGNRRLSRLHIDG